MKYDSNCSSQISGQCSHKGKLYQNGQNVPIEDQPCLSCTCRRSILQCYLRVCPPIISLEAHRKTRTAEQDQGDLSKCRMVKEPDQCCPSLKCDSQQVEKTPSEDKSPKLSTLNTSESQSTLVNGTKSNTNGHPVSGSVTTDDSISGRDAQRESVLLINSHMSNEILMGKNTTQSLGPSTRYDHSSVLLDALIEAAYSSAAQMSGFNMQGACLINGSFYVEGSAVLTGTNSYCQYCYCIRQKIMCVRPKCHLYISGCRPRYSSEFACCPNSYDCSTIPSNQTSGSRPRGPQEVMDKLSVALESISKLSQLEKAQNSDLTGRHAGDRALNPNSTVGSLSESIVEAIMGSSNSSEARKPAISPIDMPKINATAEKSQEDDAKTRKALESEPNSDEDAKSEDAKTVSPAIANGTSNANEGNSSSVDGFMEPMSRLGPMPSTPGGSFGCSENGRQYEIGGQIPTVDKCKHCYCGLDGIKECKIVECALKIAHNCKPVIPKDHCCPVRYDCPPSSTNGTESSSRSTEGSSRYRSENSAGRNMIEANELSSLLNSFTKQCNADSNGNCMVPTTPSSTGSSLGTESPVFSGQLNGSLEDIRGLSGYAPIVDSIRMIPDSEQQQTNIAAGSTSTLTPTTLNEMLQNFTESNRMSDIDHTTDATHLTDELNKFMMQINLNQSLAQTPNANFSASENPGTEPILQAPLSHQQMAQVSRHSQQPRMADYHSVQADPPDPEGNLAVQPVIGNRMVGIPSIEPEPIGNMLRENQLSLVNVGIPMATNGDSNGNHIVNLIPQVPNGRLLESSVEYLSSSDQARRQMMLNGINQAVGNHHSLPRSNAQPEIANLSDDYFDSVANFRLNNGTNNRTTGARSVTLRSSIANDDLNLNLNLGSQFAPISNSNSTVNPVFFDDELGTGLVPDTNAAGRARSRIGDEQLIPISRQDTSLTTPIPPQPTTGTPIGLDVDRSNETRGWLRSLSGVVNNFGRRLSTSRAQDIMERKVELQGAASGGHSQAYGSQETTAQPSILNQLFRGVIGIGDSRFTGRSIDKPNSRSSDLVMRPIESLMGVINNWSNPNKDGMKMASESTPVEIVTAPTPLELEVSERPSKISNVDSFSKRSDVMDEPASPESRVVVRSLALTPPTTNTRSLVKNLMICIDTITNQTYQANEIIPKDDPCKTCTCVLGKELCQTLVCPEKPGENCREERPRAGECCPNYLCGNDLTKNQSSASLQLQPSSRMESDTVTPRLPFSRSAPNPPNPPNSPNPPNLQNSNLIAINQPQVGSMMRYPAVQPTLRAVSQVDNRQSNHPIRTADLLNSLPGHLRFRPYTQQMPPISGQSQENLNPRDRLLLMLQEQADPRAHLTGRNLNPLSQRPLFQPNPNGGIRFPNVVHPQRPAHMTNRQPTQSDYNTGELASRVAVSVPSDLNPKANSKPDRVSFPHDMTLIVSNKAVNSGEKAGGIGQITWLPVDQPSVSPNVQSDIAGHTERGLRTDMAPSRVAAQQTRAPSATQILNSIDPGFRPLLPPVIPDTSSIQDSITQPSQAESLATAPDSVSTSTRDGIIESTSPTSVASSSDASSPDYPSTSSSIPPVATDTTAPALDLTQKVSDVAHQVSESTSSSPQPDRQAGGQALEAVFPDSIFRVSECNVYGRLYKLGEIIRALSDSCKHCTCTNMGVDCQSNC